MLSTRALNLFLAVIVTLSLAATAAAQSPCPAPGVSAPGDCFNSGDLTYPGSSATSMDGIFTNHITGQVTVTGNNGTTLAVTGFDNSGTVYANTTGTGTGIRANGGFTNSGELILSSAGGGLALHFPQGLGTNTFAAQSGSSLFMAGSGPAMVFGNNYTGILDIAADAGLTMMNANEVGNGSQTFVLTQNVQDTSGSKFVLPNSAVFNYNQQWNPTGSGGGAGGDFEVAVTRLAWASDLTGGQGGCFVAGQENYFLNNGTGSAYGTPAWSWLNLLHDINSGNTAGEVKRLGQDAARLNTGQATGQSLHLVQDAGRRATGRFMKKLGQQQMKDTAPSSGSGGSSSSVWLSPFYLTSTQDASDGSLSQVDGDWWGFSLGAAHSSQSNLNFGLGFHFLKGDLDAGHEYEADSTAWGLDIGLAANLGSGRYRPLLTAAISHTRHDMDQTRLADGYYYQSSPDVRVTTAALGLSQDFNLDP